jgi:hypothetical protein
MNLVQMEAMAEVTGVMRNGAAIEYSERSARYEEVAFGDLDRAGKVGLLEAAVDWNLYCGCGLPHETAERIIENAADGKPQDRWLEPLANEQALGAEHEAAIAETIFGLRETFGPTQSFAEFLASYGEPEPVNMEIEHGRDR